MNQSSALTFFLLALAKWKLKKPAQIFLEAYFDKMIYARLMNTRWEDFDKDFAKGTIVKWETNRDFKDLNA